MMKRLTQILASLLFVLTVVTLYLAFDFVVSNSSPSKDMHDRHLHHSHQHVHAIDDIKLSKNRRMVSGSLTLSGEHHASQNFQHPQNSRTNHSMGHDQHGMHPSKQSQRRARQGKAPSFHKGKTGIKLDQGRKPKKHNHRNHSHVLHSGDRPPANFKNLN